MDVRYKNSFTLLQHEGSMAKNMLLQGLESVTKAKLDLSNNGHFYNGFFSITIGAERLLKICAIINHLVKNNLNPPSNGDLKKSGHDIHALHNHLIDCCAQEYNYQYATGIKEKLLEFLTVYAKESRYYNLDTLSGKAATSEPIAAWYGLLKICWDSEVSKSRKTKLSDKLLRDLDESGQVGYVYELDFDHQAMTTYDYFMREIIVEKATPYLIYHLIKLLRPAWDYLSDACGTPAFQAGGDRPAIPYMYEFFPFLLSSKSDVLRTRAWTRLF